MNLPSQEIGTVKRGCVLVVEDDPQVRHSIASDLAQAGYAVMEADDGEQAAAILGSAGNRLMVDTILCDIGTSKINGTKAIIYFRAQYPSIPVVILTGQADIDRALSLLKIGVLDYLVKPVPKEELLMVLHRSVSQHRLFKHPFLI